MPRQDSPVQTKQANSKNTKKEKNEEKDTMKVQTSNKNGQD